MKTWVDLIMVCLFLGNLAMLGSSRISVCIRTAAVQGVLLGLLPLVHRDGWAIHSWILAAASITIKGTAFPWLLFRAMREANVRREVEPFVGFTGSLLIGMLALGLSRWIASRLPLPYPAISPLVVPVALFTMIVGLFLIVSRRQALTQVIGYIVLENGIYTFGLAIARDIPVLIELGVLMDMFVAVFVMGIAIYRINREFDHIDSNRLNTLKG